MAIATFSDLKSNIAGYLARGGLDAQIVNAIALFEAEYNGGEDNYFAEKTATLTTVAGTATVNLPADFNEHVALSIAGRGNLPLTSLAALNASLPSVAGFPRQAAIYPDNKLKLSPTPAAAYSMELIYEAKVPALSDGSPTNWLLTQYPNVYLYGALRYMLEYLQDGVRATTINSSYVAFLSGIQGKKTSKKMGATPQMRAGKGCP